MQGTYRVHDLTIEAVRRGSGWAVALRSDRETMYFREPDEEHAQARAAVLAGMIRDMLERVKAGYA
jgi:hypothetical protein